MTHMTDEKISTLIDDYLETDDSIAVLNTLKASPEQQKTLRNYHLIGEALRHESVMIDASNVMMNVSKLLEKEATVLAPIQTKTHWLKPVNMNMKKVSAGLALAASVAAISLFSLNPAEVNVQSTGFAVNQQQFTKVALVTRSPTYDNNPLSTRWKQLNKQEVEQHLNGYIVGHGSYASPMTGSMMPYTSFVSYDSKR